MAKAIQLTVECENRPGTLAHLARSLGEAKVNILAFQAGTLGAEGRVHVLVDNVNRAKKALESAGFSYTEDTVLRVELPDVPGALGAYAGKLAAKGINITAAYGTVSKKAKKAGLVFVVSDLATAAKVR